MMNFAQARTHMVDSQIHTCGVVDPLILAAFGSTPREVFLPERLQGIAYQDRELELAQGRYLPDPAVHAKLLQAAEPKEADVALDIACGSGYTAAILSPLVSTVLALESHKKLLDKAVKLWDKMGFCNIVAIEGDLTAGAPAHQPFSLIILNGACAQFPHNLAAQLAPGGRLLTVVKPAGHVMGRAVIGYKTAAGHVSVQELFDAASPYLSGFEPQNTFSF